MARKPNRPGRTLVVFFLGVALTYGLVALAGSWKPELGLDLQGGTRISLEAKGNPSSESLEEARSIIDQRVNGSGVAEAEVVTEGGNVIAVEIPGERRRDLVETVQRQAQLRFRLVACSDADPTRCASQATPDPSTDPGAEPSTPVEPPGAGVTAPPTSTPSASPSEPSGANRPPVGFADETPSENPSPTGSESPTDPSASPSEGGETDVPSEQGDADVEAELAWQKAPTGPQVQQFNEMSCSPDGVLLNADGEPAELVDDPTKPLVACSAPEEAVGDEPAAPSTKYLLSKAVIEGTELDDASAGIPQNDVQWVVSLEIGGEGKDDFATISRALLCPGGGAECDLFAIVLDGQVISSPYMEGVITNGQAQISGNFTEDSANSLATSLKFGALPISFEDDATVEQIGPSLAGDQLNAGLTAGAIGLFLVMIYCLLYYRGLGIVVLASLGMAAAITYAMVLLLSEAANFTLTLPGIAGLIIAVGITADSFIILFERIRDEMRDGKSVRVAVESGWARARNTCLAADAVSLLAAVVLYIFAAGAVRGFAFALGLSTLIDLVVFFWFTKPFVSWLARFRFYSTGSRWSGLSDATLGVDVSPTGVRA
jgi:preprotein translocase subunit SecD